MSSDNINFRIVVCSRSSLNQLCNLFNNNTILHKPVIQNGVLIYWKWSGEFSIPFDSNGLLNSSSILCVVNSIALNLDNNDQIIRKFIALDINKFMNLSFNINYNDLNSLASHEFDFGFEIFV
jgi:hypothetical protein